MGTVSAQEETTMTISVTDENETPIPGATVTAQWEAGENYEAGEDSAETRSNGDVLLDVPTNATVELTAEHPEYVQNIPVRVEDPTEDATLEMREPGSVTFTVIDTEENSVDNVRLRIRHRNSAIVDVVKTNQNGVVEVQELEQRPYTVDTIRPGYLTNTTQFEITTQTEAHRIQIESKNVEIEFSVIDSYLEEPLEGATISMDDSPAGTTTSDGTQVSRRGVNDNYEITVEKDGYETRSREIRLGEEPTTVNMSLRRTPEISIDQLQTSVVTGQQTQVTITNAYGDPVSGATISVNGAEVAETNEQGVAMFQVNQTGDNEILAQSANLQDSATIRGIDESDDDETTNQTEDDESGGSDSLGSGFGALVAVVAIVGGALVLSRRRR